MITVTGKIILKSDFDVELNITEDQWDNLSERDQDSLLESHMDIHHVLSQSEIDEIDIWDIN